MPQYVFVDNRPVILSKHKRDVISHGRPLSPLGSLRSISPYVPRQAIKDHFIEQKHGDTLSLKSQVSVQSTPLTEYQKLAQDNLITINNNLSNMLQETCSGIDSICQKVRLCLLEANTVRTAEILENVAPTKSKLNAGQQLSICEEEPIDPDGTVAELLDENDNDASSEVEEPRETEQSECMEKPKRIPSITPFVTILNPKTQSAESVGVKLIQSITSKLGLSRKCTVEGFQKSMKEIDKLSNYENILTTMVDDVNEEINKYYSYCQNIGTNVHKKDKKKRINMDKRPKTSPIGGAQRSSMQNFGAEELKRIHEFDKSGKHFTQEHFSENDLTMNDSMGRVCRRDALCLSYGKIDFSQPDVYRKRAITDLHRRMVAQVEANDSLIFFQKLMAKNRKHLEKNRPQTTDDLGVASPANRKSLMTHVHYLLPDNYQGEKKLRSLADLTKKYQDSLWFKHRKHEGKRTKGGRKGQKESDKKHSKCLPQSYTVQSALSLRGKMCQKSASRKSSPESSQAPPCKCTISVTNNQPLSQSDKCKLHWMRAKYTQLSQKKLKYLDILDDIGKKDLIPLKPEYPRRDEIVKIGNVKDTYLYKLLYGKGKNNKKAWSELFEPSLKCSKENCKKCSELSITMNKDENANHNYTKNTNSPATFPGKSHVVRTLSKYIFSEMPNAKVPKTYTVMPVHVFYDNSQIGGGHRRSDLVPQKLPLLPIKETKEGIKRAEWISENSKKPKPMKVVYDPILRKIEKEIRMVSARRDNRNTSSRLAATTSWSPKNFSKYCSPHRQAPLSVKIDSLDKVPLKQQRRSSIASGHGIPVAEIYKRSPKATPEQLSHPLVSPLWNAELEPIAYKKDMDVKRLIQRGIEAQASRLKNDQERKIWENKYGKSVGQKLLSFIEKQPVAYEIPVPKYALPKPVKEAARQQQMLAQLRTLKHKNDSIQTNIQKAIEVIENKMVDILCKPATTESMEAFDAMEKEITNVLSMMKLPSSQGGTRRKDNSPKADEPVSDVDMISEELFRKLDKILESPAVSSSGKSSKNSLVRDTRSKKKNKLKSPHMPAKSSDMNQVCFSSTSASGEEKFTITAISPRRASKNAMVPPFIRTPNAADEEMTNLSSELRKLRNELKLHGSTEQLQRPETIEVLDRIAESEDASKGETANDEEILNRNVSAVVLKKNRIVPVQNQVVNIALVNPINGCPAGDQLRESSNLLSSRQTPSESDQDDELSHSIGDGGSLRPPDNDANKVDKLPTKDQEQNTQGISVKCIPQFTENEPNSARTRVSEAKPSEDAFVIDEQSPDCPEISGPYFTPQMSPLNGARDPEFWQRNYAMPENKESIQDQEQVYVRTEDAAERELGLKEDLKLSDPSEETPTLCPKTEGAKESESSSDERKASGCSEKDEQSGEATSESDSFYKNVHKIISRVESVYNQLEEFEEEMRSEENEDCPPKIAVFQEPPEAPKPESDAFLTPFMHAVTDFRKSASEGPSSRKTSPRLRRSPSYFNVLSFLDSLADFKEERAIEVHTSRVISFPYVCHVPIIFHQMIIQSQCKCTTCELVELPKKKSGCLKNPSSHLNMSTRLSKSKQKVSFLLQKEEKATQATACLFHSMVKVLADHKVSADETSINSSKKDEQVSAYLDAVQSKSVDKMSLNDDEDTYQSTLEFTDDISSDKTQMPEQIVQSVEERLKKDDGASLNGKNVVEIFRNSSPEEKSREKVKVFYDTYQKGPVNLDAKLISGFYNETSILQVTRSLNKDIAVTKPDSLEIISKHFTQDVLLKQILRETSLLEPLKNLNNFVDSKLLKEAIEKRQKIRMMRRKSSCNVVALENKGQGCKSMNGGRGEGDNENFLKGIYVFVYLLMFTALNLEYKCVQ